jgi:hypothetical protein
MLSTTLQGLDGASRVPESGSWTELWRFCISPWHSTYNCHQYRFS